MTTAFYTICTLSHLGQAQALARSLFDVHPGARLFIGLVDRLDCSLDLSHLGQAEVVEVAALAIPWMEDMSARYTVPELCFACKPYFGRYLLDRHTEIQKLVYLDTDILVFGSFDSMLDRLERCSAIVTPHCTEPVPGGEEAVALERIVLRAGILNAGFFALRRSPSADAFLDWFASRLRTECLGWAGDQVWLALAPTLFPGVSIDRDPGLNMAAWNARSRRIEEVAGRLEVNGTPLVFYHYSGFDPDNPLSASKVPGQSIDVSERMDLRLVLEPITRAIRSPIYRELRGRRSAYGQPPRHSGPPSRLRRTVKALFRSIGLEVGRAS